MKRFCKVVALLLAVLMLVTMATACKKSDEDEWETLDQETNSFEEEDGKENTSGNETDPENETEESNKDPEKEDGNEDPETEGETGTEEETEKEDVPEKAPETQEEVVEQYKAEYKYEVQLNPLLAETKEQNHGVTPSFDIDSTGFVKNNVKLADLKGKTFTLITALKYGCWDYVSEKGEPLNEFTWFEDLKDTYGINVKYVVSRYTESISQALTYMNAGKALDCIPTHFGGFPQFLNISQPLDPYINMQNLGNSPGVDLMTLEETRYAGGYRCISPIGTVDVLWYNKSMVEEFGLEDPHTLWQQDKWDWNAWQSFLKSVPTTTADGKPLASYDNGGGRAWMFYPLTNGVAPIAIDTESSERALINNWMDERVLQAMDFYTDTYKSLTQHGGDLNKALANLYSDGTLMMGSVDKLMFDKNYYDYANTHKFDWVPYPKSPYEGGRYVAANIGYTMMLPRKMKTASNAPYAVKFMELWATRFTEAMFDYLSNQKAHSFTYAQKKEYFEFAIKNTYFAIEMGQWRYLDGANLEAMRGEEEGIYAAMGNDNINYRTWHTKVANIVEQAIKESMEYAT